VRGEAPRIIVIDEAAYMPEKQFTDNILPILGNGERALLAISTPGNDSNWYSRILLKLKGENTPLNVIAKMLACTNCRLAGRAAQCQCNKYLAPAYKSMEVMEIQRAILDERTFQAEIQAVIGSAGDRVFSDLQIEQLKDCPRYTFEHASVIFVAIDPSGGSLNRSRCCAVAHALTARGGYVVCY
jgi:hypothetical protein